MTPEPDAEKGVKPEPMSQAAAEAMSDFILADAIARGKLPAEAAVLLPDDDVEVHTVELAVCQLCLDGMGIECHTPGCVFWMHDVPNRDVAAILARAALDGDGQ